MSTGIQLIRELFGIVPRGSELPLAQRREQYDRAAAAFALPDCSVTSAIVAGVEVEWVVPPQPGYGVCLYLHGGGYHLGSPRSHRHVAAAIATASGTSAIVPHYRLAPEHPFPAAVDDAFAVYTALLDAGHGADSIVFAGDSAGGGLAVACALKALQAGFRPPAAIVGISPWVDLSCGSASRAANAERDPVLSCHRLQGMATAYLADATSAEPLASPLCADLSGLPPLLIQVGSDEILLGEAEAFAAAATTAGVDTTLEVWPGMIHVWHWYGPLLPESDAAIERIANFMNDALAAADVAAREPIDRGVGAS